MSDSDIKRQFEEVAAKIKQAPLPASVSALIDVLLSLFHILSESTSNQTTGLRQSIDNLTKIIAEQNQTIHDLARLLEKSQREKTEADELIMSLKTMLKSKDVDMDALKRLLFQGGREQKKEPAAKKSGKTEAPKAEPEKDGEKKKRNRLSNKEKLQSCDAEADEFLNLDKCVMASSTKEEATKELPEFVERDGQKYRFVRWTLAGIKISQHTTYVKVKTHSPVYEPVDEASGAPAITVTNPEKDFLPKTPFGYALLAKLLEERLQKRIPMNRIAKALSLELFPVSRQQLAGYFIKAADWLRPACECLMSKVLSAGVIHLDETFVHCREEENSRQYMLVFTSENGCFYHYTNSRSQTEPFGILQEHFGGDKWTGGGGGDVVISTDGWYDVEWLKAPDGGHFATLVGCMVHLRRYFWDVCAAHENHVDRDSEDFIICDGVLKLLRDIFHMDGECKTPEERTAMRKSGKIREKFDEIKKIVELTYEKLMFFDNPKCFYTSKYVKAITYAHNQWEKFARIMEDGNIPLTNSEAERCIRDLAVLRHAMGCGFASIAGAKAAAIYCSFHETCKKFGIRLSEYLEFLFRHIGRFKDKLDDPKISSEEKNSILEPFMPWNFAKS